MSNTIDDKKKQYYEELFKELKRKLARLKSAAQAETSGEIERLERQVSEISSKLASM